MRPTHKIMRPARPLAVAADGSAARALVSRTLLLRVALVAAGIGVLTAGAWASVPFYPVPMTMQTLAVLLVGGLLGPRLGAAAAAGYLALGLTGAPVFHGGLGGPAVLAGPTGGYLLGFLPAAFLMGLAARRGCAPGTGRRGLLWSLVVLTGAAVLAEAVIYAVGVPWLAAFAGLDADQAVTAGLFPFLLGDLVKMVVAIVAVSGGKNLLARWGALPI
jgi:biotin transport system substrate-specific component